MSNRRRSGIRIGALLILAISLWGAGHLPARAQDNAEKIAAMVNGEFITENEFYDHLQTLRAQDFILSVNPLQVRSENAGQLVMIALINERLILQYAAKINQNPTDAEVDAELMQLKLQPNVSEALAAKVVTEDKLKQQIKVSHARFNIATSDVSVTPQDVEAFYKAHIANYTIPERWELSLIRTGKLTDVAKIDADVKANKPFADLVKTYSDDERTKAKNGLFGTVAANDNSLPPALKDAVRKLKVGEVSPPVKLDLEAGPGKPTVPFWYFVKLNKKDPETVRPFGDVKDQAGRLALLEKAGGLQAADKKILQFRSRSEIKVNLPAYASLANTPK